MGRERDRGGGKEGEVEEEKRVRGERIGEITTGRLARHPKAEQNKD